MNNHFETVTENKNREVKYKILVWPNITKLSNLEKDSYVLVLRQVIKYVNTHYPFVHWTVVTPKNIRYGDNVETIICNVPEHPNAMRNHFDLIDVHNKLNHRHNDYDIVYSHLPEHTVQLSNYFYNHTGLRPIVVGYCHWYEVEENVAPEINTFNQNIIGTLEMKECGVNSQWLKNLVIEKAAKTFNDSVCEKLQHILQPHILGTDIDLTPSTYQQPKSILFNHRSDGYTGWKRFLKLMDSLWTKRQDFKVYMTFPADETRDYLTKIKLPEKSNYYNFIKQMFIGVAMFKDYSAWSLSTTDGLSRGIPYLLPNKLCYPEMVGSNYSLFYESDTDFLAKLENALDTPDFKQQKLNELKDIATSLSWQNTLKNWFGGWNIFGEHRYKIFKTSEVYDSEIIPLIQKKIIITKAEILDEFNWGNGIPWSYYRNMLRMDKRIKMSVDHYEFVG